MNNFIKQVCEIAGATSWTLIQEDPRHEWSSTLKVFGVDAEQIGKIQCLVDRQLEAPFVIKVVAG